MSRLAFYGIFFLKGRRGDKTVDGFFDNMALVWRALGKTEGLIKMVGAKVDAEDHPPRSMKTNTELCPAEVLSVLSPCMLSSTMGCTAKSFAPAKNGACAREPLFTLAGGSMTIIFPIGKKRTNDSTISTNMAPVLLHLISHPLSMRRGGLIRCSRMCLEKKRRQPTGSCW